MAVTHTQDERLLTLTTPLGSGTDILLINDFTAAEEISRLFVLDVRAVAQHDKASAVTADALIGKEATVAVRLPSGARRLFNGIVSRFAEAGQDADFHHFYLQIVPWLWLLTLTSTCRIFQDQTVPAIVTGIFDARRLGSFKNGVTQKYPTRDYTTQYRETDFNFVSRLMEDEGIFYFFSHSADERTGRGTHTLVMGDLFPGPTCPNQAQAAFAAQAGFGERADRVFAWQMTRSLRPGRARLRDHHFQISSTILEADEVGAHQIGGNENLEVYDFPGGFAEKFNRLDPPPDKVFEEGRRMALLRMEEEDAPFDVFTGLSFCRAFCPGFKFDLTDHSAKMNGSYVLTAVKHSATQDPPYRSGDKAGMPYQNSFTCIPAATPYRPARTSAKPVIQGLQTAVVAAENNNKQTEISVDKLGRVLVIFHWDIRYDTQRHDTSNEPTKQSSAWIRVAQFWAGKGFGAFFWPRVGDEVVVGFLEGDPDRPLIVGSVYNDSHMPPYTLPGERTKSGIKTHSTPGGKVQHFNELRFEDAIGKEEIHLHAENALSVLVEGSESRSIGGTRTVTISNAGKSPPPVADSLTIKLGDRKTTLDKGTHFLTVTLGDSKVDVVQGNEVHTVTAGDFSLSTLAGATKVIGKSVDITGLLKVTISCGASTITLLPALIEIKAPIVKIN